LEIYETNRYVSGDAKSVWDSLLAALPFYRLELTLIRRIGERLSDILREPALALQLLFQDSVLSEWYATGTSYRLFLDLLVEGLLSAWNAGGPDRVIRVLEVGAGTGALTAHFLSKLPESTGRIEYVFTDVSASFFAGAKEKLHAHPFITYRTLD